MTIVAEVPLAADEAHRPEGWFARLARFSARRRRMVMVAWLVGVLAAAPLALGLSGALSGAGWEAQGSTAQEVRDELRADFPDLGAESAVVVYHQTTPITADPSGLSGLVADLQGALGAGTVLDPTAQPPEAGLIAPDGRTALIPVRLVGDDDAALPESARALIDHVETLTLPAGATAEVTGEWPVWADFNDTNEEVLHLAELVSGLPTIILLLIAFGSAVAAGLPLLLALAGIAVGLAVLNLATAVTPLSVWSMNFSMMIGLAVGAPRCPRPASVGPRPRTAISPPCSPGGRRWRSG